MNIEKTLECSVCESTEMMHYREYPTILWYDGHMELNICKGCGNIFTVTRPVETNMMILNATKFEAKRMHRIMMMREQSNYYYRQIMNRLNEYEPQVNQVLWDAGCGTGRLLKNIHHSHPESFGSTVNIYTQKLLTDAGVKVYHGSPYEQVWYTVEPESVDVVTMINTLGYSYHIGWDIRSASEALHMGGLIYISLYDFNKMKDNPIGGYLNYPKNHVIRSALNSFGVKTIMSETINNELHIIGRKTE